MVPSFKSRRVAGEEAIESTRAKVCTKAASSADQRELVSTPRALADIANPMSNLNVRAHVLAAVNKRQNVVNRRTVLVRPRKPHVNLAGTDPALEAIAFGYLGKREWLRSSAHLPCAAGLLDHCLAGHLAGVRTEPALAATPGEQSGTSGAVDELDSRHVAVAARSRSSAANAGAFKAASGRSGASGAERLAANLASFRRVSETIPTVQAAPRTRPRTIPVENQRAVLACDRGGHEYTAPPTYAP